MQWELTGVMCLVLEGCGEGIVVQINSGGEVPRVSSWIHSLDTKFRHALCLQVWNRAPAVSLDGLLLLNQMGV